MFVLRIIVSHGLDVLCLLLLFNKLLTISHPLCQIVAAVAAVLIHVVVAVDAPPALQKHYILIFSVSVSDMYSE